MLMRSYTAIIIMQITPFNEIAQHTNMTTVEHLLHSKTILHINEKVTKSCKFNY